MYLMAEALVDPLKASDVGVLVAGFALALANFALAYFVLPQRRIAIAKRERAARGATSESPMLTAQREAVQTRMTAEQELSVEQNLPGLMCRARNQARAAAAR